jgi:trimeric autotransporter adhesin
MHRTTLRTALIFLLAAGLTPGCSDYGTQPPAVAYVEVTAPATTAAVYGELQLSATVRDQSGQPLPDRPVSWSSSAPALATVTGTGRVSALGAGTVSITATSEGRTGALVLTILPPPVAALTLTPAAAAVMQGGTTSLTAELRDERGNVVADRTVDWTSGTTAIATVAGSGVTALVQGIGAGTVINTAVSEGRSATASITVSDTVATVTVMPAAAALLVGQSIELIATARNASGAALTGRTVTWQSSAPAVISVSNGGVATALMLGTAIISASVDGKSGSAVVTTNAPPPG